VGVEQEIASFIASCQRVFREDSPGVEYLRKRGYSFDVLRGTGLGYYRGSTTLPLENDYFRKFLWHWGEGTRAIVYPLRTLGGSCLGFQLGAIDEKKYEDFFFPGAGKRGLFFYPDTFDWKAFHRRGKVVLVEGGLDSLALSLYLKCVLSCITARVSKGQGRSLKRWATEMYCAFDDDEAGEGGFEKLQKYWRYPRTLIYRISTMKKDPQEMFEEDPIRLGRWVREWAPIDLMREAA